MAKYRVTSPEGQTFEVTAPDGASQADILAYAKANMPKPSLAGDFMAPIRGAVDKLKADVGADYQAGKDRLKGPLPGPVGFLKQSADDIGRSVRAVGDVGSVLLSPAAGAANALVIQPGARALDRVTPDVTDIHGHKLTPAEKHQQNVGIVSTSLAGLGPEAGGVGGAGKAAAAVAKPNALAPVVESFDRAGVTPMLAAGGGKGMATATNVVAENPVAGAVVRNRLRTAVAQTGDAASGIAAKYGETRGRQITGENVQQGVQDFAQDKGNPTSFAAKANARYDDVFGKLDTAMAGKTEPGRSAPVADDQFPGHTATVGGSQIETPATTATLNQISGGTQSVSIGKLIADPTLSKAASALETAQGARDMSFNDLRRLRTWTRDAQKNPELRQNIGAANLQRLEGSLTQDIYTNAEKLGSPDLAKQLRRTDQFYAAGQQRIQGALDKFAGAKSGEGTYSRVAQAAGSTASADAQSLLALKRSLAPDQWGDVAANVVSELGKQSPGAAPAGEPGFSVASFVTNYNKLSPRGKDILFGSVGGGGSKATQLRAELDNLATVADSLKGIEKGANTSKSFVNAQAAGTLAGLVTPHTAGPTILALAGEALTGEAMTNPLVVRWLSRIGTAQKASPSAVQSTVKQLGRVARANTALVPLYQEAMKLLPAPQQIAATAGAETQPPQRNP